MADIIDSASEIEELQRNTAIKMRRQNYQTEPPRESWRLNFLRKR